MNQISWWRTNFVEDEIEHIVKSFRNECVSQGRVTKEFELKLSEFFEIDRESPYMLFVANINKHKQKKMTIEQDSYFGLDKLNVDRSDIPAVTHVDYTARIQSVNQNTNPRYHQLLTKFYEKYRCPVIVNTSFNVRGEPIICSPIDAYKCFMRTEMDYLIIGNFLF